MMVVLIFLFTLIFHTKVSIDLFAYLFLWLNILLMLIEEINLKKQKNYLNKIFITKEYFLPWIKRNIYSKKADKG